MVRRLRLIACVLIPLFALLPSCGGGGKKTPKDPVVKEDPTAKPPAEPETEEDREKAREAAARQIVPEGSNCLPAALKGESAPRLELSAVNKEAIVCAVDAERERLLGQVACWKADLDTGDLQYQKPMPIPSRGYAVKLAERCARGFCLPKDAKTDAKVGYLTWNSDGNKVALNVGDDIHLFEVAGKSHESSFSIRGDKGVSGDPTHLFWVGDSIFVEASDGSANSPVWAFKAADGTQMGPLEAIGKEKKPLSTHAGSFMILEPDLVAISEQGLSSIATHKVSTGARAKLVRKLPKTPCKADETEAFWSNNTEKVPAKCKDHMTKHFAHYIGADAFAGNKSILVLLRDERLGEMLLLDKKTLAEVRTIRMPWCEESGDGEKAKPEKKGKPAKDDE